MAKSIGRLFRLVLLVAAGLALMEAYLTRGIIGGGDATWYSLAVGDFLTQVRAGVFPVWVGQSRYLFYGGIFPLRVAPYLEHFAALVDLATGRQLPPFRVLNLTLAASLLAGILSCYACLARVVPKRPWMALAWAFLYASCPGVIGLAYAEDLYMSFMTLPFLPVVFLGIVRSFESDDLESRLLMAGGLAGAWLAHPPIALSCGLVAVATQLVRVAHRGFSWRALLLDLAAVGAFLLLAGYSLVSVASIPREPGIAAVADFLDQVRFAFPDNWRPLPRPVPLDNLQLGYGLAALYGWALAASVRRPDPLARALVASSAVLLTAIFPVPLLTAFLWHAAPQFILNVVNVWPMQRFLVVISLCTLFGSAVLCRHWPAKKAAPIGLLWILLVPAVAWSGSQSLRLVERASRTAPSPAEFAVTQRPENLAVTNMFIAVSMKSKAPRYASGGVMDAELENRLLDPISRDLRGGNVEWLAPGYGPGPRGHGSPEPLSGLFTGTLDANPGILDLAPRLTLAPGKRYVLVFGFLERNYTGTLLIEGKDFFRQYNLPMSGEPRAFGSAPESSRVIPLWTTSDRPLEVQARFIPTSGEPAASFSPFARFELRPYEPENLPVRLESLVPYRARVRADAPSFLETPRLAVPTYRATVDGAPVAVQVSPDGYVIVPVGRGAHEVTVEYAAPVAVQMAYWASAAAWLAFALLLACLVTRA
ncbi:MAG TPA: hypothetical protein VII09_10400, partial [Opitutaceae bacterium]